MRYIHHLGDWPEFTWREDAIASPLAAARFRQGELIGRMKGLGFDLRNEAMLTTLTDDVLKSSEIEGEDLDKVQVRSSIARRLGMDITGLVPADRNVEGVVEMMLDATQHYDKPLTEARLYDWHASLFPTGRSGMQRIAADELAEVRVLVQSAAFQGRQNPVILLPDGRSGKSSGSSFPSRSLAPNPALTLGRRCASEEYRADV